jgi:MFS superfamily sulfate permease-like transporter
MKISSVTSSSIAHTLNSDQEAAPFLQAAQRSRWANPVIWKRHMHTAKRTQVSNMNTWVRQLPPIARLFAAYNSLFTFSGATLKKDLIAGLTVSLVAIPQSLAYAQLAGVPAYYGLYAALIPTIIGALFGSSRQLSTGPATSLLTVASVAPQAVHSSELKWSASARKSQNHSATKNPAGPRIGALISYMIIKASV